jgi:hypothetical protein
LPEKTDFYAEDDSYNLDAGFKFAVGISSPRPVSGENYSDYLKKFGRITAELWVDGAKSKDIPLKVCSTADHATFHEPHADQKKRIEGHRNANQFLCPVDGKIDVYGAHFTEKSSNVKIFFRPCDERAKRLDGEPKCEPKNSRELNLQGKMMVLLLNKQELVLTPSHDVEVKKHTILEEIAFTRDETAAEATRIMYTREQLSLTSRLFFKEMFANFFPALGQETLFNYKLSANFPNMNQDEKLYHQVDFELSRNLNRAELKRGEFFTACALAAGLFAFCQFFFGYIFSLFMPWFLVQHLVLKMFRMDPAKGKPPTKIHKAENCTVKQKEEMIE